MKRKTILAGALMASLAVSAQTAEPRTKWLDPNVNRVGTEAPRASFFAYESQELARQADKSKSNRYLSLEGMWRFHWVKDHDKAPKGFHAPGFDDSQWTDFPVPGLFELEGFGDKVYVNVGYGWRNQMKSNPPYVEEKNNYTGSYRREIEVPAAWKGMQIFLHIGSATSNVEVWANGKHVGYAEDSKMESEYNVTQYLKPGKKNLLALQVMRWCDGSYGEDQDFWRFTGISREVYLYARPAARIQDMDLSPSLQNGYKDGVLNISLQLNGSKGKVMEAALVDRVTGKVVAQAQPERLGGTEYRTKMEVPGCRTWSAEAPNLYDLTLTLKETNGKVIETVQRPVGFRSVEIRNAQVLVNGQPVLIKGANRHELDPDKGYIVSVERMIEDIKVMKELNMNAVRTCHYSDDPRWYDLCDEYGLYVCAEANFESHGMGYGDARLAQNPDYKQTIVERNVANWKTQRNHPSVIFWSLGNESGYGDNFEAAYDTLKQLEKDFGGGRPVQYEQAYQDMKKKSDLYCPMYADYNNCENYCKSDKNRPLIQCEYAHAMGNSMGGFKEYWDLTRKYPKYQGGFIWDFVDQGLRGKSKKTGKDIWLYGGDDGYNQASDHNFNSNGVIAPDRSLNPHAHEVRYYYQNYWLKNLNLEKGSVELYNENFFKGMENCGMKLAAECEGTLVATADVATLDVAPQQTRTLQLPAAFVSKVKDFMAQHANREVVVNVDVCLRADEPLLRKGYTVAQEQFVVQPYVFDKVVTKVDEAQPAVAGKGKQETKTTATQVTLDGRQLSCAGTTITVNPTMGVLESVKVDGKEMLMPGFDVTPNLWRAPTDNDFGASFQKKFSAWKGRHLELLATELVEVDGEPAIRSSIRYHKANAVLTLTYRISKEGEVIVHEALDVDENAKDKPQLLRFGMQWVLPEEYNSVQFYGRGPNENYIDRNSSERLGLYTQKVTDQFFGYVRPQENGNKTDIRYWRVLNAQGRGLEFRATGKMECSALNYLPEDLDGGEDKGRQQMHSGDLMPRQLTVVQVQQRQMGTGCVNSWGAWPRGEYQMPYKDYDFTYVVRPVK